MAAWSRGSAGPASARFAVKRGNRSATAVGGVTPSSLTGYAGIVRISDPSGVVAVVNHFSVGWGRLAEVALAGH
jgi:hypothetical protein